MEEEEATDVMVDGGKELLELAQAVPQASEAGLARLSLRFTTVVRKQLSQQLGVSSIPSLQPAVGIPQQSTQPLRREEVG